MTKKKNSRKKLFKRKGESGSAKTYISRGRALKKLQISLKTFRKLCILKGIYPRAPPKSIKDKQRTYYHEKDIKFLLFDPLIEGIRKYKVYKRKLAKIKAKKMYSNIENLQYFHKPEWNIDHVIKERFPTFDMAVKELDEALSMTHLFGSLPSNNKIFTKVIDQCKKISLEFQLYVIKKKALKKVFVSIKGIYYQVVIEGREVLWLDPWPYTQEAERDDVDYRVMYSFLQLHLTLLGFVNFRLYKKLGLNYPPVWDEQKRSQGEGITALITTNIAVEENKNEKPKNKKFEKPSIKQLQSEKLLNTLGDKLKVIDEKEEIPSVVEKEVDESEEIDNDAETFNKLEDTVKDAPDDENTKIEKLQEESLSLNDRIKKHLSKNKNKKPLFTGFRFFLGRETLKDVLIFVIMACGGEVSWEGETAPYPESDPSINYYIMDRPKQMHSFFGREYVQPQWVFDSVNENFLLPVTDYAPGKKLPDHLSPFVNDEHEGYTPKRREEILRLKAEKFGISLPDKIKEDENADLDDSEALEEEYLKGIEKELSGKSYTQDQAENKDKKKKKKSIVKNSTKEGDLVDPSDHDLSGLLPNKKRRLFQKIERAKLRKQQKIQKLKDKRKQAEKKNKTNDNDKNN